LSLQLEAKNTVAVPFSVDSTQLTIWNGTSYIPFFIKGVNLGIAKPGTYPGELLASKEQYSRWFSEIKQAGFNCIRIYTLHFPLFYEELKTYNLNHPQHPLYFFQGVWLNEEMEGYKNDLYQMSDTFRVEIEENLDCVHGKREIGFRYGKAYGKYTADVSKWNLGYIIGREVYPDEVLTTNENHKEVTNFTGSHFAINGGSATEVWWTKNIDYLLEYESEHYDNERPVSVSSWPTLDPITHPEEPNRTEDTVCVDMSKVNVIDAPAGFFISYHAYPYYPDFIGKETKYQQFRDNFGPNSYLGYITDLKKHYPKYPLIIAEYGVPSSWGVAHYTSNGMNHGGFDELKQGETNLRLLNNIKTANAGGGIQFSWIDEWFKKTWINDPTDFLNRILWHNITSAEQNFGLVKFTKKDTYIPWKTFDADAEIKDIKALANFDFFQMEIGLKSTMDVLGECWIAFDTYGANLGESLLPNGSSVLPNRSEFALHITQHSAELYVTEAYDLFGIWHKMTNANQKFQSTLTNGAPWNLVRWKNNSSVSDVQFIGNLSINRSFQPISSKDAVTIYDNKISIRIPWTLLQFVDPSQMRVFHDNKTTPDPETKVSDGIAVSIQYKNKLYQTDTRFTWPTWQTVTDGDVTEEFKTSYWTAYNQMSDFNSIAIACPDTFDLSSKQYPYTISTSEGILKNDFDVDGETLIAVLLDAPNNGFVDLNPDGSFIYLPKSGYDGTDNFRYCIFDGQSLSKPTTVYLNVTKNEANQGTGSKVSLVKLYPNPAKDFVTLNSELNISAIRIFDLSGKMLYQQILNEKTYTLDISKLHLGLYFIVSEVGGRIFANKLLVK
jgi:hypothetical protein